MRDGGVLENLAGAFDVGSFQADDDGNLEAHFLGRGDEGLGDGVALGDAAEDVDQHALDVGIGENDAEGFDGAPSFETDPPTSRKLAGMPPWSLMMSMVAIAKPAPLTRQPMLPSRAM